MGCLEASLSFPRLVVKVRRVREDLLGRDRQGKKAKRPDEADQPRGEGEVMCAEKHGLARVDSNHHRRFQRPVSCH